MALSWSTMSRTGRLTLRWAAWGLSAALAVGAPIARASSHTTLIPNLTAQTAPNNTGELTLRFTERSPHSQIEKQKIRMHWQKARRPMPDYQLADESFWTYVPADYDGQKPYGLLVFISPGGSGACPANWRTVLNKHKLIWIGANNAGNFAQLWRRMGLALDAAHNLQKRYRIDKNRVYISGFSGGGRTSSRMSVIYADLFDGAAPMGGCDYFKTVTLPSSPENPWRNRYIAPPSQVLNTAKKRNRYVLFVGADDFNREQTLSIYQQGFLRDGFFHADYLELPEAGHVTPPPDWFDRMITLLDAPLAAGALDDGKKLTAYRYQRAQDAFDAARRVLETDLIAGYRALEMASLRHRATPAGVEARKLVQTLRQDPDKRQRVDQAKRQQQVDQLLRNGRNYVRRQYWRSARLTLESLLKRYPDQPEVEQAKALLKQVPSGGKDPDLTQRR